MKILVQILLLFNLCFTASSITFEYKYQIKEDTLFTINSLTGNISVVGNNSDEIFILQQLDHSTNSKSINRAELSSNKNIVTFLPQSGLPLADFSTYEIRLPNNLNIRLNLFDGELEVRNINGSIEITKIGGSIKLDSVKGTLNVSNGEGSLKLVEVSGNCNVKVLDGDIFINNSDGDFVINSGSGNIDVIDFNGSISLKTYVGDCKLKNINGGTINTITRGGNILIESIIVDSSYFKTLAGDISAENIDGEIRSETYGGVISAKNINGKIILENYTGNISVDNIHGEFEINAYSGDVFINRFIPNYSSGNLSKVKIISGDLAISYAGDNVALDLTTQGGRITSNIAQVSTNYPYKAKYKPSEVSYSISANIFNGNIIVNKGEFDE